MWGGGEARLSCFKIFSLIRKLKVSHLTEVRDFPRSFYHSQVGFWVGNAQRRAGLTLRCAWRSHSPQSCSRLRAEALGNPHLELRWDPPRIPEGRPASAQLLRPPRRRPLSGSLPKNHRVRPTWQGPLFHSTSQPRSESQGLHTFLYSPGCRSVPKASEQRPSVH